MQVYVVIVTFNAIRWIKDCLLSLKTSDVPLHVIVVDNGSSDGTLEYIGREFPEVAIMAMKINLGFGKANNAGIEEALKQGADFVYLLNQDAYFFRGSLQVVLQEFLKLDDAAIVSPVHLTKGGANLDFAFYQYTSPANTALHADGLKGELQMFYPVPFVNAAAWIVKADAFRKAGMFHPVFEHYDEDVEFCHRLSKLGYRIFVTTALMIIHDRDQTRKENRFFNKHTHLRRKLLLNYFLNDNKRDRLDYLKFMRLGTQYILTGRLKDVRSTAIELVKYRRALMSLKSLK